MSHGFYAVIIASLLLGIIPSINNAILLSGMSSSCIVFLTYFTSSICMLIVASIKGLSIRISKKDIITLLFVGFAGLGMTGFLLNLAYELIPVGLVTMLHFLYPSIISFIMVIVYKQKISCFRVTAILLSITGMYFIADLSGNMKTTGIIIALCSSITYSFYFIMNEKGSISGISLIIKLFYVSSGIAFAFGILTFMRNEFSLPVSGFISLQLFGFVGIGSMVAFFLITYGIKKIGASTSSFINMLEPITSLIFSSSLYHYYISKITLIGCLFVLASVLLIALDDKKNDVYLKNYDV